MAENSQWYGDRPEPVEPQKLTPRQKKVAITGAGLFLAFFIGTMVPRDAPQPQPAKLETPGTNPQTNEESRTDLGWFNQQLAKETVVSRLLMKRQMSYFLGRVDVYYKGRISSRVGNPILLNDADIFFPNKSVKPDAPASSKSTDLDFKLYAIPTVLDQADDYGDYGDRISLFTEFLAEGTTFQFFDPDGNPVEMPDVLLPQDESPFMQHVVYSSDLSVGTVHHDHAETTYNIHAPDGTRVSYIFPD